MSSLSENLKPENTEQTLTLDLKDRQPGEVFRHFVEAFHTWWPAVYTWSGDKLVHITIEAKAGGACYELGPEGFRCDWGRVLQFEPPHRLVFRWQISPRREPEPDPERASEVEVRFEAQTNAEAGTTLRLTHRHFDRHGDGWQAYQEGMFSEYGWPWLLSQFVSSFNASRQDG